LTQVPTAGGGGDRLAHCQGGFPVQPAGVREALGYGGGVPCASGRAPLARMPSAARSASPIEAGQLGGQVCWNALPATLKSPSLLGRFLKARGNLSGCGCEPCGPVTSEKNAVSALSSQRQFGSDGYETAWTRLHKLRRAMVRPGRDRPAAKRDEGAHRCLRACVQVSLRNRHLHRRSVLVSCHEEHTGSRGHGKFVAA
jgi:hypothetical protein